MSNPPLRPTKVYLMSIQRTRILFEFQYLYLIIDPNQMNTHTIIVGNKLIQVNKLFTALLGNCVFIISHLTDGKIQHHAHIIDLSNVHTTIQFCSSTQILRQKFMLPITYCVYPPLFDAESPPQLLKPPKRQYLIKTNSIDISSQISHSHLFQSSYFNITLYLD